VDALITAKAKKSKDNENIIIKIIKEEKQQDARLVESIKVLSNTWKNVKSEKDSDKEIKSINEIIKQAIVDYNNQNIDDVGIKEDDL